MGMKPIPPMGNIPVQSEPTPGYRGRYDAPPFEDIPPGVDPPVPGFEPSPFEKPTFGPVGPPIERDRLPPHNYRDPYRPQPYVDGPGVYRDMTIPPVQTEIPVHMGDQSRYRDNYRAGYRDQPPMFRDGQPYRDPGQQPPYRDTNFRGGPPPFRDGSYRNHSFREGGGFRENVPPNFREGPVPFRPPSADPREPVGTYHDSNYRESFREENGRDHIRSGYRANNRNRGGSRRNPNVEQDRHRDREGRDRERYNETRDPSERVRDTEKRYDKERVRDGRDDRPREHEKNREYEKDRDRDHDRVTPDKKARVSPKRTREIREKKRSESRGRSRDRERENRREKKEERSEKTSAERSKDHKDKDKKMKDRKKKKREKEREKEAEKKKKREKKEKKDKDSVKKEDDESNKSDTKEDIKGSDREEADVEGEMKTENKETEEQCIKRHDSPKVDTQSEAKNDLYGDESAEAVDKDILQNYVKTEKESNEPDDTKTLTNINKDEPFDGIELQVTAEELDLKADIESHDKEMLAPLPELSKWEVDEENIEKSKEPGEITSPEGEEEDGGKVTSEVLKRAENAIFAKAISSLRPIEIKKNNDRIKVQGDESQKSSMNNIQITVPVVNSETRSIEINDRKRRYSKTPPPRLSVKERLGGKVEEVRRTRDTRVVQSTVERVKSRSKTPKRDQPYRRVTVDRDRGRKLDSLNRIDLSKSDRRIALETGKNEDKYRNRSPSNENKRKEIEKSSKEDKKLKVEEKTAGADQKIIDRERKKSTLDEAHFEPDYDENVETDNETKDEPMRKRERSNSVSGPIDIKKIKHDNEIKLDLTNVKKKQETESESSSDSEYSSSSSSSDARKRKKKKKRNKKKKKRAVSDSDSDSDTDSDDHKKKKKKRKHKKKSNKKKKKSKHK